MVMQGRLHVAQVDMRPSGRTALDPEGEEQAERKSLLRRKKHEQVTVMRHSGHV